ncbi:restriction endonuclease subunit S [Azovibrio restrictus]|uniref:restriction endonuclease subunit S n=1 Tax=Azovibrio restrictus TaxID=146938 RepID=UPI0026EA5834|nr:restriction endonuclease subunit S [Azovibrio restrictus]
MDLQNIKLKELPLSIIDGDRSSKYPKREEFQSEGVVFLNSTNIFDGRLDLSDANYISEEKYLSIKKGRVEPGDIVMTTRGSIGKVARIPKGFRGLINAQMLLIRADEKMFSGAFLFHWLRSEIGQTKLRNFSSGAAQPQIPIRDLQEIEVPIPSLIAQRRIASILSAYDDLIENNTRRIAILEEMARRIYEEWFVRFRFPGHEQVKMVESELGLIPEGWVAAKLGSLIEFKKGKKPALVSNQWSDGLMPHLLIDSLRGADRSEFVTSEKMVATTPNDTIMVMDGSGSCDVFIGYEGVIGSTLGRYRVSELSKLSPYWLYLFFVSHLDEIKTKNIGAAIPHANKDFINGMTVPLPMHEISNRFDQTISPIFEFVRVMKRKNKNLRATRDLLLPRLISGELDVSTLPEPEEAIAA